MNHSFNTRLAAIYGIEEAIVIEYLFYWINKNVANGKHLHEGRYWTYNSARAFSALFPYMDKQKPKRVLRNLVDKGVILRGNFNKEPFDKTNWYTFTDMAISELQECGFYFSETEINPKNGPTGHSDRWFKNDQSMVQNRPIDGSKMTNRWFKNDQPIPITLNTITKEEEEEKKEEEKTPASPFLKSPKLEPYEDIEVIGQRLLQNTSWLQSAFESIYRRNSKIKPEEIPKLLEDFISYKKATESGKQESDFKSNFINWASLQSKKNDKEQPTGRQYRKLE